MHRRITLFVLSVLDQGGTQPLPLWLFYAGDALPTSLDTPILLLAFNRPDLTARVFQRIREVRPKALFVAADGARPDRPDEAMLCDAARAVVERVDWPCNVQTLFQSEHKGCKRGVQSGISWFFENVESGIILEDDCVPAISFFGYCQELLQRFRNVDPVMMIAGTNRLREWKSREQSYHASYYGGVWGWATWRRAWMHYDPAMARWERHADRELVRTLLGDEQQFRWRAAQFDAVHRGEVDTWDWAWVFARLVRGGVSLVPSRNLVANVGFDARATHTVNSRSRWADLPTFEMPLPLRHPATLEVDRHYDRTYYTHMARRSRLASLLPHRVQTVAREVLYGKTG